jgi:hypothetical protein
VDPAGPGRAPARLPADDVQAPPGDSQKWLAELERLAIEVGAPVFAPIGDLAALATFRLDGHPYAPLAAAVEEIVLGALV